MCLFAKTGRYIYDMAAKLGGCCSESRVENKLTPMRQRALDLDCSAKVSSSDSPAAYDVADWKPLSTQRNNPPAVYWVNE